MIPRHLRPIARQLPNKKNCQRLSLVCLCGCEEFYIYVNRYTPEEQAEIDAWNEAMKKEIGRGYAIEGRMEPDGTMRHWRLIFPFIKREIFPPSPPAAMNIEVLKVRCAGCDEEHLVFDNRFHGYDGTLCADEIRSYTPTFVQRRFRDGKPRRVELSLEYEEDLEEFEAAIGEKSDPDTFTDSFSWITIYAIDSDGKRTKLLDSETA